MSFKKTLGEKPSIQQSFFLFIFIFLEQSKDKDGLSSYFKVTRFSHQMRLIIGEKPGCSVLGAIHQPKPRKTRAFHARFAISEQFTTATSKLDTEEMKMSPARPP